MCTTSHPETPVWGAFPSLELMVQAAQRGLCIALMPTCVADQALVSWRRDEHDDDHHHAFPLRRCAPTRGRRLLGWLDGVCAYSILHLLQEPNDALARMHRLLALCGFSVSSTAGDPDSSEPGS